MNELKTLKDFEDRSCCGEYEQLKQEAIKWIKTSCNCSYPDNCDCWSVKFMDFFNITDEDLK